MKKFTHVVYIHMYTRKKLSFLGFEILSLILFFLINVLHVAQDLKEPFAFIAPYPSSS